jgi:hypothetical protein
MSIDELITELLAMREERGGDIGVVVNADGDALAIGSVCLRDDPENFPEDYNMDAEWVSIETIG